MISKVKVVLQARTGSKRYPEKILKKIDHRVILEFMIDSLLTRFSKNNIIIATTKSKRDNKIIKILKDKKIKYFRGSEQNVLKTQCCSMICSSFIISLSTTPPTWEGCPLTPLTAVPVRPGAALELAGGMRLHTGLVCFQEAVLDRPC